MIPQKLRFRALRRRFPVWDPEGVQSVKKEDFVRVLPKRKEYFRSVGLLSSKIDSLAASKLDSKYVLVKAVWQMRFERRTGEPVDSQNSTTYILSKSASAKVVGHRHEPWFESVELDDDKPTKEHLGRNNSHGS
jgi:hypothetical protein